MSPPRPSVSAAELRALLAPLERARGLPAATYRDEATFAFELVQIFGRRWLGACRVEDVDRPGAYATCAPGGSGVVVVRGADLALRAFHDVCPHRGAPLVGEGAGRLRAITCPYHGMEFDLAGRLQSPAGARLFCTRDEMTLAAVPLMELAGFVLVASAAPRPRPDVPVPPDAGTTLPRWLAEATLAPLWRGHRARYEVAANWKLLAENFQESHHFRNVHPGLEAHTPSRRASSVLGDGPWLGGTMELVDGSETVSTSGLRRGRPFLAAASDRRRVCDALLFPSLLTSLQPDYLLTYRLEPLGPVRTGVVADIHFHPAAAAADAACQEVYDFWDVVNAEDRAICERQQRALASSAFVPARYTDLDDGVHAFDRLVARAYAAGRPRRASARRGRGAR